MNPYLLVFITGAVLGAAAAVGAVIGAVSVGRELFPGVARHRPHIGCCRPPAALGGWRRMPWRREYKRRSLTGVWS